MGVNTKVKRKIKNVREKVSDFEVALFAQIGDQLFSLFRRKEFTLKEVRTEMSRLEDHRHGLM